MSSDPTLWALERIAARLSGVAYAWGQGEPRQVLDLSLAFDTWSTPWLDAIREACDQGLDCGGLVGVVYAALARAQVINLTAEGARDRGAVHPPDPARRLLGGWLWEAQLLSLAEARPGDLCGWEGRRHVGIFLEPGSWRPPASTSYAPAAVGSRILEAAGTRAGGGKVRVRTIAAGPDASRFFVARPRAHIVAAWADGRRVPFLLSP